MHNDRMERRNSTRVSVGIDVHIRFTDRDMNAQIMNMSLDGMFLKTPANSSQTALLLIANTLKNGELSLQFRQKGATNDCVGIGKIAWRSDLGFGIDFTNVNAEFERFLNELIESAAISEEAKNKLLSTITEVPLVQPYNPQAT